MPAPNEKEIRIPKGFGAVEVRSDTLNVDDRTVEVCWTTGARVKRYSWDEGYYMEELAVDNKAIRMDRFGAMALLDTHESWSMDSRLGTVVPGSIRIDGGKGYATIKFSRKQKAEEILQDLRDGHPVSISVGYKIHRYEKTEGSDGQLPILRATDWEPMELSAVPVPADAGAYSRSQPSGDDYDTVLVRQDTPIGAAPAATKKDSIMNKRDAAKSYKGEKLDALALGAGITRNANETDEALSVRLLAAYDAEDAAARATEEAQRRSAEEATRREQEEAALRAASATGIGGLAPLQPAVTQAQVEEQSRTAVANERRRVREIEELARSAGIALDDQQVRTAIDTGTTIEAFRNTAFDVMIARQAQTPTFPHVSTRGGRDAQDTMRRLAANGIMHRHGLAPTLEAGANEYRNMTLVDLARECLAARGESPRGAAIDIVRRSLNASTDFPIILGDITRQTMMNAYTLEQEQNTFQLIGSRNVLPDLREVKVLEMGNGPELEEITEKGEYKRGTVRESEEGFTISHYGKVIGLTEKIIINDQLGAFSNLIANWGRVVARLEGNITWGVIISNKKLKSDNTALFHANHGNLAAAGTALDKANLIAARKAFRLMKDIDGQQISLAPTYVFTGTDLEVDAQTLIQGITSPTTTDQIVPQAIKSMQPVYESRIDGLSAKAWFLFASPAATLGRGLQYAYLAGYETPRTMERHGFDYDGVEYRLDHYFGAGLTDYRFAYKNPGL
ncbi:hypothetical protein J2X65_003499 [Ancylobacter sp. 3268]|uniref:prohead protease/major capsid protein fusion protein n=1 Tax=Ancylobacter sp. 3268 TaxID=2817752 RepID=UPI00285A9083|nr:prohead protease/major capsid protein fusion protein [Ancylobacter sp. 3268]MDR6954131.1 hypothetical protein [Ancylobacter sp. 3268]